MISIVMIIFCVMIVVAVGMIVYGVESLKKDSSGAEHEEKKEGTSVKLDEETSSVRYSNNFVKMNEGVLYCYFTGKRIWICENCETENEMTEDQCQVCGCIGNKNV